VQFAYDAEGFRQVGRFHDWGDAALPRHIGAESPVTSR
jgi:hypothetical protein